uniref:Uncharacterized protein n=1 Tax=Chromera velia CCMP2878 TaxID=1169474 RepID=A0A0G4G413_9ALVE|eukprot:Cvel_20022.t1-p1 / transcript=Cvel_20022.t1 / gene=Cvel_20022 / organism=Chromera_velia_CCMP2878 / gene_product=hypothetical protein / transcript_product=hypothetical protein / location=Cvel_scaffold1767:35259-39465(+) / protein_length=828 / sequence_SO=supercontig / SO=protein_coding / is_pseudo=false
MCRSPTCFAVSARISSTVCPLDSVERARALAGRASHLSKQKNSPSVVEEVQACMEEAVLLARFFSVKGMARTLNCFAKHKSRSGGLWNAFGPRLLDSVNEWNDQDMFMLLHAAGALQFPLAPLLLQIEGRLLGETAFIHREEDPSAPLSLVELSTGTLAVLVASLGKAKLPLSPLFRLRLLRSIRQALQKGQQSSSHSSFSPVSKDEPGGKGEDARSVRTTRQGSRDYEGLTPQQCSLILNGLAHLPMKKVWFLEMIAEQAAEFVHKHREGFSLQGLCLAAGCFAKFLCRDDRIFGALKRSLMATTAGNISLQHASVALNALSKVGVQDEEIVLCLLTALQQHRHALGRQGLALASVVASLGRLDVLQGGGRTCVSLFWYHGEIQNNSQTGGVRLADDAAELLASADLGPPVEKATAEVLCAAGQALWRASLVAQTRRRKSTRSRRGASELTGCANSVDEIATGPGVAVQLLERPPLLSPESLLQCILGSVCLGMTARGPPEWMFWALDEVSRSLPSLNRKDSEVLHKQSDCNWRKNVEGLKLNGRTETEMWSSGEGGERVEIGTLLKIEAVLGSLVLGVVDSVPGQKEGASGALSSSHPGSGRAPVTVPGMHLERLSLGSLEIFRSLTKDGNFRFAVKGSFDFDFADSASPSSMKGVWEDSDIAVSDEGERRGSERQKEEESIEHFCASFLRRRIPGELSKGQTLMNKGLEVDADGFEQSDPVCGSVRLSVVASKSPGKGLECSGEEERSGAEAGTGLDLFEDNQSLNGEAGFGSSGFGSFSEKPLFACSYGGMGIEDSGETLVVVQGGLVPPFVVSVVVQTARPRL